MGFFDKFKSERDIVKEEIVEVPWHVLSKMEELDEAVEKSKSKPVVIFKHSNTCGISKMVLRQFEKDYKYEKDKISLYFLDLKQYRNISNEIESRLGIRHESPQLLVIKNGVVIHNDSHQSIDAGHLAKFI